MPHLGYITTTDLRSFHDREKDPRHAGCRYHPLGQCSPPLGFRRAPVPRRCTQYRLPATSPHAVVPWRRLNGRTSNFSGSGVAFTWALAWGAANNAATTNPTGKRKDSISRSNDRRSSPAGSNRVGIAVRERLVAVAAAGAPAVPRIFRRCPPALPTAPTRHDRWVGAGCTSAYASDGL